MSELFPLVTAVAICYNHERFVIECLNSIKNQTYKNIQLIVIDNCSKDNSIKKIEDWIQINSSISVLFIPNDKNLGVCAALNLALVYAKGQFFQFISCDDVLNHDKIAIQVSFFSKLPVSIAFVYSNFDYVDENGKILPEMNRFAKNRWFSKYDLPSGRIQSEIIHNYFLCAPTLLYRTSCINDIGAYNEAIPFEDFQMNLRLLEKYSCQGMMEILCKYRILTHSFYNSSSDERIEKNYLHSMKYVYGQSYQHNWLILLRYISAKQDIFSLIIKKIVFYLLFLIGKNYKKEYGIK